MTKQFDLAEFEAFCLSKPADEEYPNLNRDACALAQFGFPGASLFNHAKLGIPSDVYAVAVYSSRGPTTFSALASRLSRLREK